MVETITFLVAAAIVLAGAAGVILSRNPVHAALSLVASLFGIAVLFVAQDAHLLAAVQVIVYTGAIVVLILFVLMLLGVDKAESLRAEPIAAQRPLAVLVGALGLAALAAVLLLPVITGDDVESVGNSGVACTASPTFESRVLTGQHSQTGALTTDDTTPPDDPTTSTTVASDSASGDALPPCSDDPPPSQVPADVNVRLVGGVLFTDFAFAFEATALLLTIAVVGAVVLARRVRDPQPLPEPESMGDEPDDEPDDEEVSV